MRLKFVSADTFRAALREKQDVAEFGILKSIVPQQIKAIDVPNRIVEFTISTATVDRQSDTIDVTGWDLANYSQNPVVLFAHDQWNPPIAQALATWIETNALKSRAQFVEREISPFAYMIFQLYVGRYMRATSVGFRPLEYSFAEDRKWGINFIRQELLEYSCVPVPANADALADAKAHGVELAPMKGWAERWLDESRKSIAPADLKARSTMERLRSLADPDGRSLMLCMGDLVLPGSGAPPAAMAAAPIIDVAALRASGVKADATTCDCSSECPCQGDEGGPCPEDCETCVADCACMQTYGKAAAPAATVRRSAAAAAGLEAEFPFTCAHGHGHKTEASAQACQVVHVQARALPAGVTVAESFRCSVSTKHRHLDADCASACIARVASLTDARAKITALVPAEKQGRVLSQANEDRLTQAGTLIDEVLAQLAAADPVEDAAPAAATRGAGDDITLDADLDGLTEITLEDDAPIAREAGDDLDLSLDDVREAVGEAVREVRMQLTGQVD